MKISLHAHSVYVAGAALLIHYISSLHLRLTFAHLCVPPDKVMLVSVLSRSYFVTFSAICPV